MTDLKAMLESLITARAFRHACLVAAVALIADVAFCDLVNPFALLPLALSDKSV